MDGTNSSIKIIHTESTNVYGLTLDFATQHLYWTLTSHVHFEMSDLDGLASDTVSVPYSSKFRHNPTKLAVYKVCLCFICKP